MINKLKNLPRRPLYALAAGAVALSLVIGGAFAWADNSQHKSNIATGGGKMALQDIVLVEDYEKPTDWKMGQEVTKKVSVKNTGEGQLFTRIQLKEYMDIAKITYAYTDEFLLTDSSGKFVAGTTAENLKSWLNNKKVVYDDDQIVQRRAYGDTADKFYLRTNENTNINGMYGKQMLVSYTEEAPKSLVDGVTRADYEETNDHRLHPTGECDYTCHLWKTSPDPFHEYVQWNLGAGLIKMSEWNGQPVAAWILDDASDEGWAYWGEAINPGAETTKLLESIKLIKQPAGPFYYTLHVDMQATDLYELGARFTGMPAKIENSFRGKIGFGVEPDKLTVTRGGKVNFTAMWNDATVSLSDVTWTVAKLTAPGLGERTKFNAPGILSIGPNQSYGGLLVTASYTSPEGVKTREFVITVKEPATPAP